LLSPLHHLEMMVEQKFPLSGNQLMQCHSAKILLVMLPASFRLHQWTYDEKSHYIEVVQGAIFDGTEYEHFGWQLSQPFYRKKRPIIGSLEEHYPLSAVTSMNSATVNLWLVFSMKTDSIAWLRLWAKSLYRNYAGSHFCVFRLWTSEQLLKMKKRRLNRLEMSFFPSFFLMCPA